MKKITLLFALLISSIGFSQEIVTPVYEGTFDGTTYSQTFNFPTGAQSWAGFANNNVSIYPLSYPNGGQISFKATVATNAEIKFVFEKDLYPNVAPSVSTVNVALLATNPANTVYTVAIPANATNTYKSALMYVVTRDVAVSLSEIKLIKFDTDGTTQLKVDFPIYDGTFDGTTYSQTFNFPTGAQNWAGFANNNTTIYPLSFTNVGKVSFKATVATNAEIKFVFEKDLYPNVTPSVSTANVALLATNPANTLYEVAIPANTTNTYKSALMYVITRDVEVSLSEIKIHTNAATPPPTATYDLPFDFETSPVTSDWEGFEGALITVEAVAAPQTTGNSSTNLAKIIRNGGQTYAGVVTTVDTALDFSTKSTITARIWTSAPIGTKIMFKTEEAGNAGNNSGEKNVFTTKTGEWEDLVFDFAGVTKASQTRIVIIPDNGNLGDGSATSTFYFDDIIQTAAGANNTAECAGNSSEAQQGSFSADYSYGFETLTNGDVRLTFAMPSGTPGLVAYAWKQTPFAETSMTVSGTVATLDIAGYSNGESISYAVKFAWAAGGFGVTKYFTYIVGDACALGTNKFDLASFKAYPNPTKDTWTVTTKNTNISSIQVYDVLGRNVLSLKPNAIEAKIDASSLKTGVYFVKINTLNGSSSLKLVKE